MGRSIADPSIRSRGRPYSGTPAQPAAPAARASPISLVERRAAPRVMRSAATAGLDAVGRGLVPEVRQQHRDRQHGRGRVGLALPCDVGRGAVDRLEHAGVGPARVDVAAGCQADAAGDRRTDVGEDVSEQVVGDHDVEPLGLGQEEHGRSVHVAVVASDLRELRGDLVEGALPQRSRVDQHVGLVDQRDRATAGAGSAEGIAHDPLDAEPRVEALLGRHLVRSAPAKRPAGADVRTLGALPADDHVDVGRALARQWRGDAREQLHRTQVHVVVELEAQRQQDPALEDPRRHARVTDRAQQDRVLAPQLGQHRCGQRLARGVVAAGAEVVVGGRDEQTGQRRDGVEHLQALGDHLGPDPVPGNDSKLQLSHGRTLMRGVQTPDRWFRDPSLTRSCAPPLPEDVLVLGDTRHPVDDVRPPRHVDLALKCPIDWMSRLRRTLRSRCSSCEATGSKRSRTVPSAVVIRQGFMTSSGSNSKRVRASSAVGWPSIHTAFSRDRSPDP